MKAFSSIKPPVDGNHLGALMQAISSAEIFVLYQTPDLIYRWAENLPCILSDKWHHGCRDSDMLDIEQADSLETIKLHVLTSGKAQIIEMRFEQSGQPLWYRFSIDCHRNDNNEIIGIITTGIDISELRRREQVLKILLREVSHRSKNLLAIIQSIANQTARYSDSIGSFLRKFQGRIQSLSFSQDLVTDSDWRGAGLHELILSQVSNYLGADKTRLTISGDDPYLFPGAALHIGLALHELIINSISYGALSQPKGRIEILIQTSENRQNNELVFEWREIFNTKLPTSETMKSCFGSAVLEKIVPTSINGKSELHLDHHQLVYRLFIPENQFDIH